MGRQEAKAIPFPYAGDSYWSFKELTQYGQHMDDFNLLSALTLSAEYCPDRLLDLKEHLVDEQSTASLIFTTVHQSKGLEWDSVFIHEGKVSWHKEFGTWQLGHQS